MSVRQTPVNVMRTLIAPTAPVLTAVLVNRDLLEMGQLVKVSTNALACSRLSVVEDEGSEREKKRGWTKPSPPSFFSRSLSLVLNNREPGTG